MTRPFPSRLTPAQRRLLKAANAKRNTATPKAKGIPKAKRYSGPTEHEMQVALFTRIRTDARTKDIGIFAIPNGGHRHPATAKRLKAEGALAGVPDIFVPRRRYAPWAAAQTAGGLFVEMKRGKEGWVNPAQAAMHKRLANAGYQVEVCRSTDEAWRTILHYLGHDTD